MAYSLIPSTDSVAKDLAKHFIAAMLDGSNNPLFVDGYDLSQPNLIALFEGVWLDSPDNAGFLIVDQDHPVSMAPQLVYKCTLTLRAKESDDYSSQALVNAYAKAFEAYLRPNGEDRCNVVLPSGRLVRSFNQFAYKPIGQDTSQRYTVAVMFQMICIAD